MALLHVALEEGFLDETVVVRLNAEEIFRKEKVTTRLQIGLADSFGVEADDSVAKIEVVLPSKGVSEVVEADLSSPKYLGVSFANGRISTRLSDQPFMYA